MKLTNTFIGVVTQFNTICLSKFETMEYKWVRTWLFDKWGTNCTYLAFYCELTRQVNYLQTFIYELKFYGA